MQLNINVQPVNDAPQTGEAIPAVQGRVGQPFEFVIPENAFFDPDADAQLSLTSGPLPPGLNFEDTVIVGTPTQAGNYNITLMAEDEGGLMATNSVRFEITA